MLKQILPSRFLIYCVALLFLAGCKQKFDKKLWKEKHQIGEHPYRNSMVDDLFSSHKLVGLSYTELIDLLGQPEQNFTTSDNTLFYSVLVEYGMDIDPVHTKTLVITLASDSTVLDAEILEWEK